MAFDASKPAIADNYSTGYTQTIRDNFDYLHKMGEASGANISMSGATTGVKRYSPSGQVFEYWNGSAWATLPLAYLPLAGGTCTGNVNFSAGLYYQGNEVWCAGNFNPANKANVSGQVFTGAISTSSGNITAAGRLFGNGDSSGLGFGKLTATSSTSAPTGGSQGDIHVIWA